jgi:hypothetical protein
MARVLVVSCGVLFAGMGSRVSCPLLDRLWHLGRCVARGVLMSSVRYALIAQSRMAHLNAGAGARPAITPVAAAEKRVVQSLRCRPLRIILQMRDPAGAIEMDTGDTLDLPQVSLEACKLRPVVGVADVNLDDRRPLSVI